MYFKMCVQNSFTGYEIFQLICYAIIFKMLSNSYVILLQGDYYITNLPLTEDKGSVLLFPPSCVIIS